MANLILISGPPRSGKDTLAKWISNIMDYKAMKFAEPIERALRGFFGLDYAEFAKRREDLKDEPWPLLGGKTFRNCMQSFSEDWAKQYGQDIFGRLAAYRVRRDKDEGFNKFVFSDCGFTEEVIPVLRHFLTEEIVLVRLFREGCSYDGDTRSYPNLAMLPTDLDVRDYHNNGTEEHLFLFGETLVLDEF